MSVVQTFDTSVTCRARVNPNGPHFPNDLDPFSHPRWRGYWPMEDFQNRPPTGTPVLYVLCTGKWEPLYVGSTQRFYKRMEEHEKAGKEFHRWIAYECASRNDAYNKEALFLSVVRLPKNRRGEGFRSTD
jgi:predicted GIY-YIG superfamily endonuclease